VWEGSGVFARNRFRMRPQYLPDNHHFEQKQQQIVTGSLGKKWTGLKCQSALVCDINVSAF
jgi:hypothetical protein